MRKLLHADNYRHRQHGARALMRKISTHQWAPWTVKKCGPQPCQWHEWANEELASSHMTSWSDLYTTGIRVQMLQKVLDGGLG